MKSAKLIFTATLAAFVFTACSTSRQYYQPTTNLQVHNKFKSTLPSEIIHKTADGATLSNGKFLNKKGVVSTVKLSKEERFLGSFNTLDIVSNFNGEVKVYNQNRLYFKTQLDSMAVSASSNGVFLAVVTAKNTIYLINLQNSQTALEYKQSAVFSQDSTTVAPLFTPQEVLFATLDGKVLAVSLSRLTITRDIVVGGEYFFNNIIALNQTQNGEIIAATSTRVGVLSGGKAKYFDAQIKTALITKNAIFLFLKNGEVKKLSTSLTPLASREFKYAIFTGAMLYGEKIFAFEKNGYAFELDLGLNLRKIHKLNRELDSVSFIGDEKFFCEDSVLDVRFFR